MDANNALVGEKKITKLFYLFNLGHSLVRLWENIFVHYKQALQS